MKKRIVAGVAAVVLVAIAACAQEPGLAGTWAMTSIGDGQESYSGDALEEIGRAGETLEFTEDGEVSWDTNDASETGTYVYDTEARTLSFDVTNQDDQNAQYELVVDEVTADTLMLSLPDVLTFEFERQ